MNRFDARLDEQSIAPLSRDSLRVLQLNITRRCNMACSHCHVESSPSRDEHMDRATMQRVIAIADRFAQIDITGGAPEIHPDFRWFITELHTTGTPIQVRTNLTIHSLPAHEGCLEFLAEHGVALVASLPCYMEENVTRQRGKNVFTPSIAVLRRANALGYGRERRLPLHLVYNPVGTGLPGPQQALEEAYRRELRKRYEIVFTGLFTITNMPIGRFARDLERRDELDGYLQRLDESFNPETVPDLMCRHQIEVDWDGSIYDCDFNLALGLRAAGGRRIQEIDPEQLLRQPIATGSHCLGCTAGCGSSCGGALVDEKRSRQAG
ncbi:MAG: arsenosugar biosynthesis radical SAM (seleno)protein ArsS [Planctomycetota bacterium]